MPRKMIKDCENCEQYEKLKHSYELAGMARDAQIGRIVERDTKIINGLLREIDALYLLLQKQGKNGDSGGNDGGDYISNCQNMHF